MSGTNIPQGRKSTKIGSKKTERAACANDSQGIGNQKKKFKEIQAKDVELAKKIAGSYESSSDEEQLDGTSILEKLYRNYTGGNDQLQKTATFLENVLQSGSAICLICIGSVKRAEAVWSCKYCYCVFHLSCIKRWANDSIALLKDRENEEQGYYDNQGRYVPKKVKAIKWCCPQCRKDYKPDERPTQYECFCGKEINPMNQDWLVPHSCGEICGKPLRPPCGHKCLLLCHPGPCPPCAQTINISCKCGKSPPRMLRCFQKHWTCDKRCSELLPCEKHKCDQMCHAPGQCPPCSKTSVQRCVCGSEEAVKSCAQRVWHCKKVCNKMFSCGLHSCKRICHEGSCGECPLSLPRTCPCGKSRKVAPCNEQIDTCDETCHKLLSCGQHFCNQRCHRGDCSLCTIITKKKCRCGMHRKEVPCWKDFFCETKCKRMRDCGKHACNKKCCDGECPPCDKICGKLLSCKKHKCQSVCHDGPCYPCKLKSQVKCRCGSTCITVPCGRERRARPICKELCKIPLKCHHQNNHKCHRGECPPCNQVCGLPNDVTNCDHVCEARCHTAVRVPTKPSATSSILDYKFENFEIKKLPHPKCEKKVMVSCLGGHEIGEWPCWNSKPSSCQRLCGRMLECANHTCTRVCHTVDDIDTKNQQEGCVPCVEGCQIQRPEGCTHQCKKPCHPPPCDPCGVTVRTQCHCGLSLVYYKCSEYNSTDGTPEEIVAKQEKLKSCGNRCIRNYSCGHRCSAVCHSGPCPNPESCRKKVKIFCECKRLKSDVTCEKYRSGTVSLPCDDKCSVEKAAREKLKQEEAERQRLAEEERNRIELEQFEKRFGRRKYRERRAVVEEIKDNTAKKRLMFAAAIAVTTAVACTVYYYR